VSGTPNNSVLTMAGYVSDVKKWTKFERRWNEILDRENIRSFHMTDFASCHGEFEGWREKPAIRKQFIANLLDCAKKFTNKRFSASVIIPDYMRADSEYEIHERIGYPYSIVGVSCIGHVMKWARKNRARNLLCVFEDGDLHKGNFQTFCRARFKFEPVFYSKKSFVPFQAADLAAWKTRHPLREAHGDKDYTAEELEHLLSTTREYLNEPHAGGGFDYEALMKIRSAANIPRRSTDNMSQE